MILFIRNLIALSKLRVVSLLVLTALCAMWKAEGGMHDLAVLAAVEPEVKYITSEVLAGTVLLPVTNKVIPVNLNHVLDETNNYDPIILPGDDIIIHSKEMFYYCQ